MWVGYLNCYHSLTWACIPLQFSKAICFFSKKIKHTSLVALFKSKGVKYVKYVFRCCLCMHSKRAYMCVHACAHVCHRSRTSNNKRCLAAERTRFLSGFSQQLNPFHTWCLWALYVHMKGSGHICKQTRTKMYTQWYDPAVLWQAWDLGLGCGVRRPQREGKPGPNWVPLTGPWLGTICHCWGRKRKKNKKHMILIQNFIIIPFLKWS